MKSIKVTTQQLQQTGRSIPKSKHIACQPRDNIDVVSQYTLQTSKLNLFKGITCNSQQK